MYKPHRCNVSVVLEPTYSDYCKTYGSRTIMISVLRCVLRRVHFVELIYSEKHACLSTGRCICRFPAAYFVKTGRYMSPIGSKAAISNENM